MAAQVPFLCWSPLFGGEQLFDVVQVPLPDVTRPSSQGRPRGSSITGWRCREVQEFAGRHREPLALPLCREPEFLLLCCTFSEWV